MHVGDVVRLRPNYRWMVNKNPIRPAPEFGIVTRVNRIGNIDIMLPGNQVLVGVMLGNVEKVNECR